MEKSEQGKRIRYIKRTLYVLLQLICVISLSSTVQVYAKVHKKTREYLQEFRQQGFMLSDNFSYELNRIISVLILVCSGD